MHYGEASLLPFGSASHGKELNFGMTAEDKIARKSSRSSTSYAKGGSGTSSSRTDEVYIEELGTTIEVPSLSRLDAALQKMGYTGNVSGGKARQIQNAFIAGDLTTLNTDPILKALALQFAQEQISAAVSQIELERLQAIQGAVGTDTAMASEYLNASAAEVQAMMESERQRLILEAEAAAARFERNKKIAIGLVSVSLVGYLAYRFMR